MKKLYLTISISILTVFNHSNLMSSQIHNETELEKKLKARLVTLEEGAPKNKVSASPQVKGSVQPVPGGSAAEFHVKSKVPVLSIPTVSPSPVASPRGAFKPQSSPNPIADELQKKLDQRNEKSEQPKPQVMLPTPSPMVSPRGAAKPQVSPANGKNTTPTNLAADEFQKKLAQRNEKSEQPKPQVMLPTPSPMVSPRGAAKPQVSPAANGKNTTPTNPAAEELKKKLAQRNEKSEQPKPQVMLPTPSPMVSPRGAAKPQVSPANGKNTTPTNPAAEELKKKLAQRNEKSEQPKPQVMLPTPPSPMNSPRDVVKPQASPANGAPAKVRPFVAGLQKNLTQQKGNSSVPPVLQKNGVKISAPASPTTPVESELEKKWKQQQEKNPKPVNQPTVVESQEDKPPLFPVDPYGYGHGSLPTRPLPVPQPTGKNIAPSNLSPAAKAIYDAVLKKYTRSYSDVVNPNDMAKKYAEIVEKEKKAGKTNEEIVHALVLFGRKYDSNWPQAATDGYVRAFDNQEEAYNSLYWMNNWHEVKDPELQVYNSFYALLRLHNPPECSSNSSVPPLEKSLAQRALSY
jgi:hypothetical protein